MLADTDSNGAIDIAEFELLALGVYEVPEREFCIDNLLVRIHFIIEMIRWTGLAPWEFEFLFPGSLTSTFLVPFPVGNMISHR